MPASDRALLCVHLSDHLEEDPDAWPSVPSDRQCQFACRSDADCERRESTCVLGVCAVDLDGQRYCRFRGEER